MPVFIYPKEVMTYFQCQLFCISQTYLNISTILNMLRSYQRKKNWSNWSNWRADITRVTWSLNQHHSITKHFFTGLALYLIKQNINFKKKVDIDHPLFWIQFWMAYFIFSLQNHSSNRYSGDSVTGLGVVSEKLSNTSTSP